MFLKLLIYSSNISEFGETLQIHNFPTENLSRLRTEKDTYSLLLF